MCDATQKNLLLYGYNNFDTLICKPGDINTKTGEFKARVRNELSLKGLEIIISVGDQESDFEGGNTGLKVKIPNYLYLVD